MLTRVAGMDSSVTVGKGGGVEGNFEVASGDRVGSTKRTRARQVV